RVEVDGARANVGTEHADRVKREPPGRIVEERRRAKLVALNDHARIEGAIEGEDPLAFKEVIERAPRFARDEREDLGDAAAASDRDGRRVRFEENDARRRFDRDVESINRAAETLVLEAEGAF